MLLAWCFVLHFIADFLLQSREMGKKKSVELTWLYKHLTVQFIVFFVGLVFFVDPANAMLFSLWNIVAHGVIDWNIWNLYKLSAYKRILAEVKENYWTMSDEAKKDWITESSKNWQYWEDHWFYATIGLDQLLHILTIIALFSLFI